MPAIEVGCDCMMVEPNYIPASFREHQMILAQNLFRLHPAREGEVYASWCLFNSLAQEREAKQWSCSVGERTETGLTKGNQGSWRDADFCSKVATAVIVVCRTLLLLRVTLTCPLAESPRSWQRSAAILAVNYQNSKNDWWLAPEENTWKVFYVAITCGIDFSE